MQHTSIRHYGGKAVIIPLELETFKKMVLDSKKASYVPEPKHIKAFIDKVISLAAEAADEIDWFEKTKWAALNWLNCSPSNTGV